MKAMMEFILDRIAFEDIPKKDFPKLRAMGFLLHEDMRSIERGVEKSEGLLRGTEKETG